MTGAEAEEAIATVMLPERVDSSTSPLVEAMMLEALQQNARVIADGSEVTYMSAAGVRALAVVLHRAAEKKVRIVFCRFSGPAADCLEVSGFSKLLDVADSVEEATRRLSPKLAVGPAEWLHRRGTTG
jgi:anti-anti-sigma factor